MDRITKQLLNDFIETQEIKEIDESKNFEKFCNYTIISNYYNKTFDFNNITIGSGGDTGIDGVAIIINGNLIEDNEEINELLKLNGSIDLTYIFIQSKTSSSFDVSEMNTFYFGINDFFSEKPKLPRNEELKKFAEISEYALSKASDFKENPKCISFYITTGVYNKNDANVKAVVDTAYETLESLKYFEKIEHKVLGANEIGKLYRKTKNPLSANFIFANKVTLTEIEGINESYYGILPLCEFKKILLDENNNILEVFEDNVRDFQGKNNSVNQSISETLSSKNPSLFSVLNNGITIVANEIKTAGNSFTISDYQIVNGCQTSNVILNYINKEELDDLGIPFRLIVTSNEEIKAKITISTNNQTAIKKEQLSAMSSFQKNLEYYYSSIEGEGKLYYERRSKQYNTDRNIIKRKIITIPNQIKSFSSMVNKNPHMVTTYFGSLVKKLGKSGSKIFEQDHQYVTYYMAGLAYYRLDALFNTGIIDKKYKKVKFYITMLVPMIASTDEIPPLNSQNKTEKFCKPIINKLNNKNQCEQIFKKAIEIIDRSNAAISDKQALKSKKMTEQILSAYNNEKV